MKKSFRLAIEKLASNVVNPHLRSAGIKSTRFTAHKDGSCTIAANDKLKDSVKAQRGVEVIKESAISLTFRSNEMADYAHLNPPYYTDEEKAQMSADMEARKLNRITRVSGLELLDDDADEEDEEDYEEVDAE